MAVGIENHKKQRMSACNKNPFRLTAVIAGISLLLAGRATAQTFATLHSFDHSDGSDPQGGLTD